MGVPTSGWQGVPSWDWMGVTTPVSGLDGGTPPLFHQDWITVEHVIPRAVRLVRFPAWGLSWSDSLSLLSLSAGSPSIKIVAWNILLLSGSNNKCSDHLKMFQKYFYPKYIFYTIIKKTRSRHKKVLLRERKRHTVRREASTCCAVPVPVTPVPTWDLTWMGGGEQVPPILTLYGVTLSLPGMGCSLSWPGIGVHLSWPGIGVPPIGKDGEPPLPIGKDRVLPQGGWKDGGNSTIRKEGVPPPHLADGGTLEMWTDRHLWKQCLPDSFGMRAVTTVLTNDNETILDSAGSFKNTRPNRSRVDVPVFVQAQKSDNATIALNTPKNMS